MKCQECGGEIQSEVAINLWDHDEDEEAEASLCSVSCAIAWLSGWTDDTPTEEKPAINPALYDRDKRSPGAEPDAEEPEAEPSPAVCHVCGWRGLAASSDCPACGAVALGADWLAETSADRG